MKVNNIIRLIFIVVLIIGMFLLPDNIPLPAAQVRVLSSNHTFEQFETFDVGIHIDPVGTYIAGAQLNIAFDSDQLRVNKITEGDFFKQNGANTLFNGGVVNDPDGTVKNIYDFIIGNSNVSNPGIFININLTVINSSGSSEFNISNVIISDPNGNLIAVNVTNGTIYTKKDSIMILPFIRFINGTVIDPGNNTVISGVAVSTISFSTMTNASGFYSIEVTEGEYDLMASFEPVYYMNNTITVSTIGNKAVVKVIELSKKPSGNITGKVTNS